MPALIDLTDQTFGLLTVRKRLGNRHLPSGARQPVWGCICACGKRTVEEGRALRAGRAMSCRTCVRDPSRMLKYGRVYLVYFPKHRVLKIGFHTSAQRMIELLAAGGIRIDEYRDVDKSWERVGLTALDEIFPPAFNSRQEAQHVLPRGAGWSDCFTVDPEHLRLAKYVVMKAGLQKGNDFGENPPPTIAWLRAFLRIRRARRDARNSSANVDRIAGAGGDVQPDSAGCGVDRAPVVPGPAVAVVDRPRRSRRSRARGRRPRRHVGVSRPRMARSAPAWARRTRPCTARPAVPFTVTPIRPIFNGLGEREKEGTRARERARARVGVSAGRGSRSGGTLGGRVREFWAGCSPSASCPVGCSTVGVSGSPGRDDGRVRAVWSGVRAPERLLRAEQVHREVGVFRGATVGGFR